MRDIGRIEATRAALAGIVVLAAVGSATAAPATLGPARFKAGGGWHVGAGRVTPCPGVPETRCAQVGSWAATARWRDCATCAPPHKTLAALTPNGIAIELLISREPDAPPEKALAWPPRLKARDVTGPAEGVPRRIGVASRAGRLGAYRGALWVYFGRRHPTAAQLARANSELRSAKLP